jgi:hypothetical protein
LGFFGWRMRGHGAGAWVLSVALSPEVEAYPTRCIAARRIAAVSFPLRRYPDEIEQMTPAGLLAQKLIDATSRRLRPE